MSEVTFVGQLPGARDHTHGIASHCILKATLAVGWAPVSANAIHSPSHLPCPPLKPPVEALFLIGLLQFLEMTSPDRKCLVPLRAHLIFHPDKDNFILLKQTDWDLDLILSELPHSNTQISVLHNNWKKMCKYQKVRMLGASQNFIYHEKKTNHVAQSFILSLSGYLPIVFHVLVKY